MITRAKTQVPGIHRLTYPTGAVRYEVKMSVTDPVTGKRRYLSKEHKTLGEAKKWKADQIATISKGVIPTTRGTARTVDQACEEYLAGRSLEANTLASYRLALKPLRGEHPNLSIQQLTKAHVGALVAKVETEGYPRADGRKGRPWRPGAVNNMLKIMSMVLEAERKQGHVSTNVADLIDRRKLDTREPLTFDVNELETLFTYCARVNDRNAVAWRLALTGLRRAEIAGLRWRDLDLDTGVINIKNTRVSVNGTVVEKGPKSRAGVRTLQMPDELVAQLRRTKHARKSERLAFGPEWVDSGYVVVNEAGYPYHPETLSDLWDRMVKAAGLRPIHLHDARHTCGTLLALDGYPPVLIAAWLGHRDPSFTAKVYTHSQPVALAGLARAQAMNLSG